MADLVLVHMTSGEEVLVNRDQITHAQVNRARLGYEVTFVGGGSIIIREDLTTLKNKP
jgi:hypothetical protein